jgi:signal transduction histidine kinase
LQQQALIREPIVIHDLVNMILRRFLVKIESRNLKIIVDIDASAEVVKSSPHLLDAIVFNFISNAIKYGPDAGEITIRAVRSRAGNTTISVLDQGPGIAEEQRERIFDRFYRIGDARQHQVKGTGLGLFLCKYFAEGLGGHVELETEVGAGSEFRLVLPP